MQPNILYNNRFYYLYSICTRISKLTHSYQTSSYLTLIYNTYRPLYIRKTIKNISMRSKHHYFINMNCINGKQILYKYI